MVELSNSNGTLTLPVRGTDKLWALKSSLEIPLQHITEIRADPSVAHVSDPTASVEVVKAALA